MKHLYSIISLFLLLISVSLFSQDRVYAPSLTFPEDGETGLAPNVRLDWNAVTGETLVVLYELQLATVADFTDAITFDKTEITSKEMLDLNFGGIYFWRVKAYDGDAISDWSEVWSFYVGVSIEMDLPEDASMVYSNPKVTWKEMTGLLKYQIQIDTSYIWNNVAIPTSEDIFGSFIIDENNMWLVGDGGQILHFNGTEWLSVDAGVSESLNDIYFVDANNGFIVGDNGTFLTYDGSTWTNRDTDTTVNFNGVAFSDANNGYIVGEDGFIFKYASGSISGEPATDGNDTISEDFTDIAVIDANNYWVCGKSKYIVNFDGSAWTGTTVGGKDHYAIWFNNATDGWVGSKDGRLQHYDGTEWTEIQTEADDMFGISFDGTTGYAVGKSGEMVVYDGSEWKKITSGSSETLNTVYLKNGLGISAGDGGTVLNKAGEGFNSPFAKIISVNPDSTNYDLANLLFDKSFYYRMRGIHSVDTSAWSDAKSMTTYTSPEPDSPSNGSNDEHLELVFEWTEYDGVTRYYIEISRFEDFNISLNYISDSNSILLRDFNFGDDYYWRVKAEHSEDISPWSETSIFTTINSITLESPEDNSVETTKCPRFVWEEILGASGYEIYIDTDENFNNPNEFISDDPFLQCQGAMETNINYYWKVRGISGLDTSNWSPTWSFEIEGVGINDLFSEKSLEIYPNPSTGIFTIDINSVDATNYNISIVDITGKEIFNTEFSCQQGSNQLKLNLSEKLSDGVYLINVSRDNTFVNKRLLIK